VGVHGSKSEEESISAQEKAKLRNEEELSGGAAKKNEAAEITQ